MTVFHMERPGGPVKLKYLEPGPGSALTERKLLNIESTERMTVMLLGPPEMKPPEIVFSLALAR